MPEGMFDPLFPDVLADYTVDRVLVSRISLALEKIACFRWSQLSLPTT